MDPAVQLALRLSLSRLLASAASHKVRDFERFRASMLSYDVLPASLVSVAAPLAVALECALAAALLTPAWCGGAALGAAALLLAYTAAIAVNVRRGRADLDCGCAGPAMRVPVGPALVIRNFVLVAAAVFASLPVAARRLEVLDLFVVVAFTASLAGCWAASERLLALAPRMAALRADLRRSPLHADHDATTHHGHHDATSHLGHHAASSHPADSGGAAHHGDTPPVHAGSGRHA